MQQNNFGIFTTKTKRLRAISYLLKLLILKGKFIKRVKELKTECLVLSELLQLHKSWSFPKFIISQIQFN